MSIQVGDTFTHYDSFHDACNGKGSDATVSIQLNDNNFEELTKDIDTGKIDITETPIYIVLGHELIHAYEGMKGNKYSWYFLGIILFNNKSTYTYTDQYGKNIR